MLVTTERSCRAIAIGGVTVVVRSSDATFLHLLDQRYAGFPGDVRAATYEFDVDIVPQRTLWPDDDVRVWRDAGGMWNLTRGDFRAEWDPDSHQGRIRQSANPYSIDSVLRIVHTLVLAKEGGFLVHAASAVRNGRGFLFAGVSGAGKTTLSRLAPSDATLLTDEVSYVRAEANRYYAYGTPFAGELAKAGENLCAPLAAVYLLSKGPENRVDDVPAAEAVRRLLTNVLFFAEDRELVDEVFRSACSLVEQVPVRRLTFVPNHHVWELIR